MLKVCINGARTPAEHPRLSAEVNDIVAEAVAGIAAGADAVHVHPKAGFAPVQSGSTGDSLRGPDVDRIVAALREACPGVPVGVTSGAWAAPVVADRLAAIASWTVLPDFVSVNWHEDGADEVAGALRARGIGVEAGIWHEPGLAAWLRSPHRSECLRALIELQAGVGADASGASAQEGSLSTVAPVARHLVDGVVAAEPELPILLHGEDATAWPTLELAAVWGLDTRIGLEDVLVLPDGAQAAGNRELVAAALSIIERSGGGITERRGAG